MLLFQFQVSRRDVDKFVDVDSHDAVKTIIGPGVARSFWINGIGPEALAAGHKAT
jgi:hypothetical protein